MYLMQQRTLNLNPHAACPLECTGFTNHLCGSEPGFIQLILFSPLASNETNCIPVSEKRAPLLKMTHSLSF